MRECKPVQQVSPASDAREQITLHLIVDLKQRNVTHVVKWATFCELVEVKVKRPVEGEKDTAEIKRALVEVIVHIK